MPRLANERQELYCIQRARGMIPSKAAIAAGYASGSAIYTELESNGEVISRIRELIDELEAKKEARREAALASAKTVGEMTGVGRAWVIQKLAENAQLAQDAGDFKCANDALQLIGKEFGMFEGSSESPEDKVQGALANLDFDKLDQVLTQSLPAPEVRNPSRSVVDAEEAMSLIEGQTKAAERTRRSRAIDTGSETDVVFRMGDDEGEEEEQDGWTPIDPKTPPEEIIRMVNERRKK